MRREGWLDLPAMLALCALAAAAAWALGGLIPMGDGLGTDGKIYAALAADYFGQVARGVWSYSPDYYFQRSLPPLLVHLTLRALALAPAPENLVQLFRAWNLVALLASVLFYRGCARALGLSRPLSWAGFFAFFGSVSLAIVPFYYPSITDVWGTLLSLALLWAYLEQRTWLLPAFALAAGFVQPTLMPLGLLLYLLPRELKAEAPSAVDRAWAAWLPRIRLPISLAAGVGLVAAVVGVALHPVYGAKYGMSIGGMRPDSLHGVLGLFSLGASISFAAWVLLGHEQLRHPVRLLRSLAWERVVVALALHFGVKFLVRSLVPQGTMSNLIPVVIATSFSVRQPFVFLAKHALYFGPGLFVFYLRFLPSMRELGSRGLGAWAFVAPFLLVAFDLESRHHQVAVPFFLLAALAALPRDRKLGARVPWLILGGSAVFAALWFWVQRVQGEIQGRDVYHHYMWETPYLPSWGALAVFLLLSFWTLRRRA